MISHVYVYYTRYTLRWSCIRIFYSVMLHEQIVTSHVTFHPYDLTYGAINTVALNGPIGVEITGAPKLPIPMN
jgi:hypothetical protein